MSSRRPSPVGPVQNVRLFGRVGVRMHDGSSPEAGQSRLFDHDWLERVTCVSPVWLPLIFLPPAVMLVRMGVAQGLSGPRIGMLLVAGLVGWTLTEYLVHRFVFHFRPRGQTGIAVAYLLHGVHHAFPDDNRRWVMPPMVQWHSL